MPRTPGSKKLTPEKKAAVLFSWWTWPHVAHELSMRALFAEHPRKQKKTKRTKDEIARLVAGVPLCDRIDVLQGRKGRSWV
ncbi:hypothetical protein GQ600_9682 [Phytophthora cactorum]|nr:hypothetical protein GQ600_9682 [Phytophthora cactorum]